MKNQLQFIDSIPFHVRSLAAYQPGKPISDLARELNLTHIIKLASNENPRGPSPKVQAALSAAIHELPRYPDGNAYALKAALAARYKRFALKPEHIIPGNGSNEVLEMLTQVFLGPNTSAVFSQYAFAVYPLAIQARGAEGIEVPAKAYGHDLAALLSAIRQDTRMVFIANPNNPTGTYFAAQDIEQFLDAVSPSIIVILDEAYNEYLSPEHRDDSLVWLARFPNLVICRTFSKAYGLASLRVGYGLMNEALAAIVNRVRQPFNVNSLAQVAAIAALDDQDYVSDSYSLNCAGMTQMLAGLQKIGLDTIPSRGNFVLLRVGDGASIYQQLLERGIIVRPVANYGLPEFLRITIGLPEENQHFLNVLEQILHR